MNQFHSYLKLNRTPLFGNESLCVSSPVDGHVWIASCFGLWQIKLLWTLRTGLCVDMFSFLLGSEMARSYARNVFNFLRDCSVFFKSSHILHSHQQNVNWPTSSSVLDLVGLFICSRSNRLTAASCCSFVFPDGWWHWAFLVLIRCVVQSLRVSDSLQHTRLRRPSPFPRLCSNSRPLSRWCYLTFSSSAGPFSFSLQLSPESGKFYKLYQC